jgi:hypothetical protein
MKKENTKKALNRGYRINVVKGKKKDGWYNFCMWNLHKQSHMILLINFGLDPMTIQADTEGVLVK